MIVTCIIIILIECFNRYVTITTYRISQLRTGCLRKKVQRTNVILIVIINNFTFFYQQFVTPPVLYAVYLSNTHLSQCHFHLKSLQVQKY